MVDAAGYSETSAHIYQSTGHNNTEDRIIDTRCCDTRKYLLVLSPCNFFFLKQILSS